MHAPSAPGETPRELAGFRRLAVATTIATLILIAVGGAVRATDSGLACPTWPGCFTAGDFIPPADLHVWLEHSHRLIAGVVGLMIAALTLWALVRLRRHGAILWPAVTAAVLVNVQALLGALVVWHLLRAELVTAHLGLSMIVLACLIAVAVNSALPRPARGGVQRDRRFARVCTGVAGLTYLQILVGGHVTGVGAGLAYRLDGFPLMDGAIFPALTTATERQLYHAAHRTLAWILAAAVVWLCVRALRERRDRVAAGTWDSGDRWLVRLPLLAAGLVVLQILIGIANVASELSWLAVIPHLAVASWIWAAVFLQAILAWRWSAPLASGVDRPEAPMSATVGTGAGV